MCASPQEGRQLDRSPSSVPSVTLHLSQAVLNSPSLRSPRTQSSVFPPRRPKQFCSSSLFRLSSLAIALLLLSLSLVPFAGRGITNTSSSPPVHSVFTASTCHYMRMSPYACFLDQEDRLMEFAPETTLSCREVPLASPTR